MSPFQRYGRFAASHPWRVIGAWLLVLAVCAGLSAVFVSRLTGASLSVPGSPSARAEQLLATTFPEGTTEHDLVVFRSRDLTAQDPAYQRRVRDVLDRVRTADGVTTVVSPYDGGGAQIAQGGHVAVAFVGLRGDAPTRQTYAEDLQQVVRTASGDRVEAYLTGTAALNAAAVVEENKDLSRAEAIGLPVAMAVLLLAFGTVVAAGLPLLLGMLGVLVSLGVLGALSFLTSWSAFTESTVTMVGVALGIDYSLLVVTRYREEHARGLSVVEAVGRATDRAGRAVLFSGSTVLVSLSGLALVNSPVSRELGYGVMVAAAVMVVLTLTLLPAVLGALGSRVDRLAVPFLREQISHPDPERSVWGRLARAVMRRPGAVALVTGTALLALVYPVTGIRLGVDLSIGSLSDTPAGRGYLIVSQSFAAGVVSPVTVVVHDRSGPLDAGALDGVAELTRRLEADPGTAGVVSVTRVLDAGLGSHSPEALRTALASPHAGALLGPLVGGGTEPTTTVVTVYPKAAPDSRSASDLVRRLRHDVLPPVAAAHPGLELAVGGLTARIVDLDHTIRHAMPWVLAAVLGASYILLLVAFRSLLVPLKAIVMNLLSVGAAFGALVLVFQQGHGASVLGFAPTGFLQVYLPLVAFAILFGLSMDYEVFLVSRMKEEWDATGDNARAVATGITFTARVITAAAAIMVVVFATFVGTPTTELKEMGFALAVAVLVDATIIRLLLVPATMRLLGSANWYLPRWLDRLLPPLHLGELSSPAPAREPAGEPVAGA